MGASLGGKALCSCSRRSDARAQSTSAASISTAAVATISAPNEVGLSQGAVSEYASQLALSGKLKVCCVCGRDVTHARRLKDGATGRYWCVECGATQPQHLQHTMDMPCPECRKTTPAVRLVKFQDRYVCPACYTRHTGHSAAAGGKLPLLFVLGMVMLGLIIYGLFIIKLW